MFRYVLIGLYLLINSNTTFAQNKEPSKLLSYFANTLTGAYSNKKFADTTRNPLLKHQEMLIFPVWRKDAEFWFYIAWFHPKDHEVPLEQRFLHIFDISKDTLGAFFYYIPDPEKYIREWDKSKPFADLTIEDIVNAQYLDCPCFVTQIEKNVLATEVYKPCERIDKGVAAYKYINLRLEFGSKFIRNRSIFYDARIAPVYTYPDAFQFDLLTKNYLKYFALKPEKKKKKDPNKE